MNYKKLRKGLKSFIVNRLVDIILQPVYKIISDNLSSVGIYLLNQYFHYGYYSLTLTVGMIFINVFVYIYKRDLNNKKKGE